MVGIMKEIYCKDCGQKLSEDDKICPNCSSKKKHITLTLEEKIELHDQTKGKAKKQGIKRPAQEFKVGDDLHRNSGKWRYREMYIDREKNQYKEIVKNKTTGEIIHKREEPLSKHKGYGSAKHKKKSKSKMNG